MPHQITFDAERKFTKTHKKERKKKRKLRLIFGEQNKEKSKAERGKSCNKGERGGGEGRERESEVQKIVFTIKRNSRIHQLCLMPWRF